MGTDQHLTVQQHSKHPDENVTTSTQCDWGELTSEPLICIFKYLSYKDLASVMQVSVKWNNVANLGLLWKRRFKIDFEIRPEIEMVSSAASWKGEYRRVVDLVPSIEFERISEHTDEVLHVSFSNNGMMFCTCSKDATVKVFNADWPFNTIFNEDLGSSSQFRWMYTQFSQFSRSDTQLLVSGRCAGSEQGGEIIIYHLYAGKFTLQARVRIMPYDVMGIWLNESHILSAKSHFLVSQRKCLCEVLLNNSSQEVENLTHSTVNRAFIFGCENYNNVNYLCVADMTKTIANIHRSVLLGCFEGKLHEMHIMALTDKKEDLVSIDQEHQPMKDNSNSATTVSAVSIKVALNPKLNLPCDNKTILMDGSEEKIMEINGGMEELCCSGISAGETKRRLIETDNDSECSNLFSGTASPFATDDELDRDEGESTEVTTGDESLFNVKPPASYKLLVCFTGHDFYTPHQVGIKRITQEECTEVARPAFDLSKLRRRSISEIFNRPDKRTDTWDHVIECDGQVVGMTLSPCNRYLYVNVRKFIHSELVGTLSPKIASEVMMYMYDLVSMEEVHCFTGHKAVSDVFFLHVSSNSHYVASGSEDKRGYLWDRHYHTLLSTFRHEDVVNCVALNPRDPSMAVTVSDDKLIKIWRSRSFHRLLNGARAKARIRSSSST